MITIVTTDNPFSPKHYNIDWLTERMMKLVIEMELLLQSPNWGFDQVEYTIEFFIDVISS